MYNQTFTVWAVMMGLGIYLSSEAYVPDILVWTFMLFLCLFAIWLHKHRQIDIFVLTSCVFFFLLGYARGGQGDWNVLPPSLYRWSISLSQYVQERLQSLRLDTDSLALLKAMMLGQRGELSADLRHLYAETGASHILALSGLHLSILLGVLNFWMMYLVTHRWLRYMFGMLGIVLVWSYALLTGFSPSLTRASVMMTLILISQMRLSGTNGWHALGVAAVLLLLFSPSSLWSVGFQLSFSSVAGLLLFYGPLQALWKIKTMWLRWLWKGWSASLGAQLGSLPLVAFYFHQISVYSVLFSPLYILLASLILYSGLMAMAIGGWFPKLVVLFIAMQHSVMYVTSSLPFGMLRNLFPSLAVTVLIYMAIGCMVPVLNAMKPQTIEIPHQRLAFFFRQWPYIVAGVICLLIAYMLSA